MLNYISLDKIVDLSIERVSPKGYAIVIFVVDRLNDLEKKSLSDMLTKTLGSNFFVFEKKLEEINETKEKDEGAGFLRGNKK